MDDKKEKEIKKDVSKKTYLIDIKRDFRIYVPKKTGIIDIKLKKGDKIPQETIKDFLTNLKREKVI